ncbi:response regulator [Echinicola soli]|uniref:Response regulator n=1 Tax=Echinicola soli TaxID=2591634 RepID=A0A514CKE5_9BACT|nr:response regulator [Echinicola soli]QDH80321.1 response regulator [Echinicola soli]
MSKILILETDENLSDNIREILQMEGHELMEIDEVSDLNDALNKFYPDLFIIGVFLEQKTSGPATVNFMRRYHQIPVMFISDVYSQVNFEEEIREIQNIIILTKPFRAKDLVQKVSEILISPENDLSAP